MRDTWNGDYNRPLSLNRWLYRDATIAVNAGVRAIVEGLGQTSIQACIERSRSVHGEGVCNTIHGLLQAVGQAVVTIGNRGYCI